MKVTRFYAVALCVTGLAVAACDVQRSSTIASIIGPTTATTPAAAPSMLGTWQSEATTSAVVVGSSCNNLQWTVTSQTSTTIEGTFSGVCPGNINVSGTGSGHLDGSSVAITITGNATMPGVTSCPFTMSGTGTLDGDALRIPYTGTTCLGPISGTETLHRKVDTPAPAPTPAPDPPPAPAPAPDPPAPPPPPPPPVAPPSLDQLNMSDATILNSPYDLASWPVTTRITHLDLAQDGIHPEFSKQDGPDRWPDTPDSPEMGPLQYTLGMCLNIGSHWYCSAVVEFWQGLPASGGPPAQYAENWFYSPQRRAPMTGHQPAPGEIIGIFACAGDCRNNVSGDRSPVKERTNIVLLPMPGNGGGSFSF